MDLMIDNLRQALAGLDRKCVDSPRLIPSAVILPIFFKEGEYHILFIRRTQTVKDHKGQISFPGGHYEKKDKTLLNTALRECYEEIGVPPEKVEVLGELDECKTLTTSYRIATFVGLIPYPYDFKPAKSEIESIIEIPISALLKSKIGWEISDSGSPEFRFNGVVVWGATGVILSQLLEIWEKLTN